MTTGKRTRRTSGWFKRFRGGLDEDYRERDEEERGSDEMDAARKVPAQQEDQKKPPPPTIPEIGVLKGREPEGWGDDLFKNI